MLLPSEIFVYLEVFLNPEILYSKSHKQYFYNRHLIHNFTEEYFNEEVAEILKNINLQLQSGKKNEKFLKNLLNITSQNIEYFKKVYRTNLNDFKNLKHDEIPLEIIQTLHLSDEPFSRSDIQNTTDKYIAYKRENFTDYLHHLEDMKTLTSNFSKTITFEQSKLIFVLKLLNKSLLKINSYLLNLKEDFEYIDFQQLDYRQRLIKADIITYEEDIIVAEKGNFNMSKINVANLFYFLKDENIIYYSLDHNDNNTKVNRFIERNFRYRNESGNYMDIQNINKEFSKIRSSKTEVYLKFLDELIKRLEEKKSTIIG